MFGRLLIKECKQTAGSLVYWAIVLILIFDFTSQLGDMEIARKPEPGQEEYGYKPDHDPELIMKSTLGELTEEYCRENYTTYPIGFYKSVTLSEEEDRRIAGILKETAGIDGREAAGKVMEDWYARQQETGALDSADGGADTESIERIYREPLKVEPVEGLTYERFGELMDEADDILGGGSNYSKEYRENSARVLMTYQL